MKNIRQRALPHPLLSPFSTDVAPATFEFDCKDGDIACDATSWLINGRIAYDNSGLASYVEAGSVTLGIHVECPRTFYRAWFPTGAEVRLVLPADLVRGKVELLALGVAAKDINGYTISGLHEDYAGASFDVAAGDLLASAQHIEFDAYLDLDPISQISSILNIRRSETREAGSAHIDFNGDRIEVELAQNDYKSYIELRSDPSIKGLIASNVVLPAILQAVNHLGRLSADELEEAKSDRRWCRCLVARLERQKTTPSAAPEDVFRAVQEVLRDPIQRGLDDLLEIFVEASK